MRPIALTLAVQGNHSMSLLAFVIAAVVLAVTPGPGMAYVVARTVAGGRSDSTRREASDDRSQATGRARSTFSARVSGRDERCGRRGTWSSIGRCVQWQPCVKATKAYC